MKSLREYMGKIISQYKLLNLLLITIIITLLTTILDYFNLPTILYNKLGYPIIICLILFILIKLFSFKFISLRKLKSVNYIDYYSVIFLLFIIIYYILLNIFSEVLFLYFYKKILSIIIFISCILVLIKRYYHITHTKRKTNNKNNVFDLKKLYNNEIPNDIEFIFINDDEVDYDLLEREKIINQMTSAILNCHTDTKFVMSLKGDWGSGKTTILKNVKNKLTNSDVIYIDDFEPWIYNDKKSLLVAFFDAIMKKVKCGFRINELETFTNTYLKTITSNVGYNMDSFLGNNIDVNKIKCIINNYLEANDQRIVLIIDNLERCSSEQIIFILKNIHNLFNFNRIIYILSYDEKAMKKHFNHKLDIDYSYLEKIVQLEFSVPKLDKSVLKNVITKCLNNYLDYSICKISVEERTKMINNLVDNIKNLREFKRIINSSFYASFNKELYLNNVDMLFIEMINLKNPSLWNEINKHKLFYISEDHYVYNTEYMYNSEKYNVDTTNYFNNIFDSNKYNINEYKDILCNLFPNVKMYFDENKYRRPKKIQFIAERIICFDKNKYQESVINKRIFNGKFFDIYFNKNENEFTNIDKQISKFITNLNNNNNNINLLENYMLMEKTYPGWIEKYTLETFQMFLNKIDKNKLLPLLYTVYDSYYIIDDSPLFFQLNAKSRTQIIIADILLLLRENDFKIFIDRISNDYKNIYMIRKISYWLKPENRHNEIINKDIFDIFDKLYQNMIIDIKKKKINLYDLNIYNRYNMNIFMDDNKYMSFIKKKINKDNLMLFILDCISISDGSYGIGYHFDVEKIEKFYGWEKAKKDIKKCKDSELKKFLVTAIENNNEYESEDEKDVYYTKNSVSLNYLITKYLDR